MSLGQRQRYTWCIAKANVHGEGGAHVRQHRKKIYDTGSLLVLYVLVPVWYEIASSRLEPKNYFVTTRYIRGNQVLSIVHSNNYCEAELL